MGVNKHPTIEGAYRLDWREPDTTKPPRKNGRHPLHQCYETYYGNREDAERRYAELLQRHAAPASINPTIGEKLPEFVTWLELHRSKGYARSMAWALVKIRPHFGKYPVNRLTRSTFDEFKNLHKSTPAHANQCITYLKVIISWMVQRNYAQLLPFKVEKLPHFRNIPQPPSPGDFDKFMQEIQHGLKAEGITKPEKEKKELLVHMIYETGLRWVEARNVQWPNLRADGRLYLGRTKSGEARYTVLSPEIMTRLEPYRKASGYIFTNPDTNQPYTTIRKLIQGARTRSGVEIKGTHGLRHALGTDILEATDDVRSAQVALGHTNINTTMKYTKVSVERQRRTLERTRQWRKEQVNTEFKTDEANNG